MENLSYTRLTEDEVAEALSHLPEWGIVDGMLTREFTFAQYTDGLVFAAACGYLAERLNHHPDLFIGYRRVRVGLITHDSGGLTPYDFALAEQIEKLG